MYHRWGDRSDASIRESFLDYNEDDCRMAFGNYVSVEI
ncbi:MAG: hypothetical protein KJN62_05090 [Deltaproteobacteria bacterium]|nr:hypothetical protein [Deltaproteobacteria bacterium]